MLKTYCMIYVAEYFFAAGVIYTIRCGVQSFLYGQTLNESLAPNWHKSRIHVVLTEN